MMNTKTALQIIHSMSKVELHWHLEGAFTLESLYRLIPQIWRRSR